MTKYKEMKILINNDKDIARAVQRELFKLNYEWKPWGKNILSILDDHYLVTTTKGYMYQQPVKKKDLINNFINVDDLKMMNVDEFPEMEKTRGMKFKIISSNMEQIIEKKVNESIESGWKLHGYLVIDPRGNYIITMTKKEKND